MTKYKQKDSFIIHHDTASIFQELTNEQAGELIKHLIFYSNSLNKNPKEPKKPSGFSSVVTLLAFSFEKQLERDFWKYQTVCERNENNGKKGGRPQKLDKIKTQQNPKKADSDNDSDSDKDNDKESKKDIKDTASGFSQNENSAVDNLSTVETDYSEIPNSSVSSKMEHTQKQKNEEFNQFWEAYGKKVKKPKAEESFKKALKTKDTTFQSVMNGVKKYNEYLQVATWLEKADPTSWLNQGRWNDDYDNLIKQEYKKNNKTPPVAQKSYEKQQEEVKMKEDTQNKRKAILSRLNAKELEFTYFLRKHLINDFSNPVHSMWIENLVFSCKNGIALIEVESEIGIRLNWAKLQVILSRDLQGKFEFTEIKWKLID
jgi:hypothetical protein